ncbi:glycosyltransferase family protein [Tersicoccus solisilvae]|nr:glycosyltransferase [Tersicoccus solisilvae]
MRRRPAAPRRADLRVGVVLDDFSLDAFGPEWSLTLLDSDTWHQQLAAEPLDLVFIESAWRPNRGRWRSPLNGDLPAGAQVRRLVEACRAAGIPTVFWNKEDPVHYADFLDCARLADVVFTTDENRLAAYREDLGHRRVGVLPFAAQPAVHHPARPGRGWHARGIAFAGMYFAHKFPGRRDQLDAVLDGAADLARAGESTLEIFARHAGTDERYRFPERFASFVVGSLDYDRMLTAYRAYRVFLNVNTVAGSPTMCARRLFEIPASGTPVITTPSPAVDRFFGGTGLRQVHGRAETTTALREILEDPQEADRVLHLMQRRIWDEHTYAHRAEEVLRLALPPAHRPVTPPTVSALVSTFRPDRLRDVVMTLAGQQDVDLQVVLLTHGHEPDAATIRELRAESGLQDLVVLSAPRSVSLGACLNRCVEAADGAVLAKIDDDDLYAPAYLHDTVNALGYSAAEVVGKQAHYLQVEDRLLLRHPDAEHRWTDRVAGPTLAAAAPVFREHPFADVGRGEDTRFLDMIVHAGGKVYSADRFNYCQVRGGTDHTWAVSADVLSASSRMVARGEPQRIISL